MKEQDEINLGQAQKAWQTKQDSSGMITIASCVATVGWFLYFINDPGQTSAMILVGLMMALALSCIRLVSCAAKVVEVRNELHSPIHAEVIDVEVVNTSRRYESYPIARYSGHRF